MKYILLQRERDDEQREASEATSCRLALEATRLTSR